MQGTRQPSFALVIDVRMAIDIANRIFTSHANKVDRAETLDWLLAVLQTQGYQSLSALV